MIEPLNMRVSDKFYTSHSIMDILSNRNQRKLYHDGYLYVFDKWSTDGMMRFWRCENRGECRARVHELNGEVKNVLHKHNHEANPGRADAAQALTTIKRYAEQSQESPSITINNTITTLPPASQFCLPTSAALKERIRRLRQKKLKVPDIPESLTELTIPEDFQHYYSNEGAQEKFLLHDSGPSENRILIFGRASLLEVLRESNFWFGDGTFKIAPPLFDQVYVILGERFGGVHPILYALLPDKKQKTYQAMFSAIRGVVGDRVPKLFACDYDKTAINAFKNVYKTTKITGCLFHLLEIIKNKVIEEGLLSAYNNDSTFNMSVRKISALAFLKEQDVEKGLEVLQEEFPKTLQPVLDYFEDRYVGRILLSGKARRVPIFPMKYWNVHQRTMKGMHRTNSFAEATHKRLQEELNVDYLSIWQFIITLFRIQKSRDNLYQHFFVGPLQKKKKHLNCDNHILEILSSYNKRSIPDILDGIVYNIYS